MGSRILWFVLYTIDSLNLIIILHMIQPKQIMLGIGRQVKGKGCIYIEHAMFKVYVLKRDSLKK